jgi:murein DD-endopeptidase MepM/ murein hydrolase activator NlpD
MEPLPNIEGKIRRRPGPGKKTKKPIYIPDEKKYPKFWRNWYASLDASGIFHLPFEGAEQAINPFFGYYGFRCHPVTREPQSFHIGNDMSAAARTEVNVVADGILEYSGFDLISGNYLVVSHPQIEIEGGHQVLSLYMHLRANMVKFTSYQKMLREISLHTYPEIPVSTEQIVGEVGDSGNIKGSEPHLHLQVQIKTKKGKIISLDPARVLGILPKENKTSTILTNVEYEACLESFAQEIKNWGLGWCWKKENNDSDS